MVLIRLLITAIALYYLYTVVVHNAEALQSTTLTLSANTLFSMLLAVLLYIISMLSLTRAWCWLLHDQQATAVGRIYLKSQVLKYTPGNILHFVYRHSAGKQLGLTHTQLLRATITETVQLITWAVTLSLPLLVWGYANHSLWGIPTDVLAVCAALLILISHVYQNRQPGQQHTLRINIAYLLYFVIMGVICYLSMHALGLSQLSWLTVSGLYAAAWLAGYVVPGAPGGLGVREAVFVLLSNGIYQPHEALLLIAVIRLIAVFGEVLCYLLAARLSGLLNLPQHPTDKTGP
jgi:hypothetical protein